MKAWIYLRVSTEDQITSNGLDAQLDACTSHCDRLGWVVGGVYRDEGVSGSKGLADRPGLLEAITTLSRGDVLLVAKRDRVGRLDPMAMAVIEAAIRRKGARIVSVAGEGTQSDSPDAVLMRRMVDAFAEYERLVIGARTKAGLAVKRRKGERTGGVPYGWVLAPDGTTLVPDRTEQAVLARIKDRHHEGLSLHKIADMLTRECVPTKTGRDRWSHTSIKSIINRM